MYTSVLFHHEVRCVCKLPRYLGYTVLHTDEMSTKLLCNWSWYNIIYISQLLIDNLKLHIQSVWTIISGYPCYCPIVGFYHAT